VLQRNPEITHMLNNPDLMRQVGSTVLSATVNADKLNKRNVTAILITFSKIFIASYCSVC